MPTFRPSKPGWLLGQVAAQVVAGGGAVDVVWDATDWEEPAGLFDGASSVTVDKPGTYLVGAQVTRQATASSSPITVRIRVNGATVLLNQTFSTNATMSVPVTRILRLAVGDVVTINVTLHATLAASTAPGSTDFWGVHIGPERWTG